MTTAAFPSASALAALSSTNSHRLVQDEASVSGHYSGVRKVATSQRVKRTEKQFELCRAGVVQATRLQPRRRVKDEAEFIPVSHDDGGYYTSENQDPTGAWTRGDDVAGGMMSLQVISKTQDSVNCEVVDGGDLKSRRHLNVRGKSATLPSITVQSQPAEQKKAEYEGLSAKERRKLRNDRRVELNAAKGPWREMVENRLLKKPRKKAKNWEVDTDVNQLRTKGMQWWMIQATRRFENHVAEQLEIIFPERFPDMEFEVLVPSVPVKTKLKDGIISDSRRKIFQGIVLLRCIMDRNVYDLVRGIPRAYDFFGNLAGISYQQMVMPAPVSHTNMENLFRQIKEAEEEFLVFQVQCRKEAEEEGRKVVEKEIQEEQARQLEVGATIRVLSGPFMEFTGIVIEMFPDVGKVKALLTIFGKDTPIGLDVDQVDVTIAAPK